MVIVLVRNATDIRTITKPTSEFVECKVTLNLKEKHVENVMKYFNEKGKFAVSNERIIERKFHRLRKTSAQNENWIMYLDVRLLKRL